MYLAYKPTLGGLESSIKQFKNGETLRKRTKKYYEKKWFSKRKI